MTDKEKQVVNELIAQSQQNPTMFIGLAILLRRLQVAERALAGETQLTEEQATLKLKFQLLK
jgi:hypothetical protein